MNTSVKVPPTSIVETLCDQHAMYSDNYNPNTPLNVEAIYMCELLDICKDGAYMGIWQLFQVANVLQHPVKSVYPEGGNVNIRKDLGHDIHCQNQCANTRETYVDVDSYASRQW